MKKTSSILLATLMLVFSPCTAFAHSPGGYMLATFSVVIVAACLALIAKRMLISAFLKGENAPRLRVNIGVAVLEVCIMLLSLAVAIQVSPSKHSLVILLCGCLIHLVLAFYPNFYLVRTATARSAKAFLLAIIFPVLVWVLAFVLFVPLYAMFGG